MKLSLKIFISLIILLILFFNINFINSQEIKYLKATIIDQLPKYNDNFNCKIGSFTTGLLKNKLGVDSLPELFNEGDNQTINNNGGIINPKLFKYFYNPNQNQSSQEGYNYPNIDIQLPFIKENTTNQYIYKNQSFFPIDLKGFDIDESNRLNNDHNYFFTMKIHINFNYNSDGINKITILGDDDTWVFIDDNLVLDLGGIHDPLSGSIYLNELGLNQSQLYSMYIFFAQRQESGSSFNIISSFDLTFCEYIDYCGICMGNGSSCCNDKINCNDNNECTIDECPPGNSLISSNNITDYCKHTPIKYNSNSLQDTTTNQCIYQCNSKTGIFEKISSCSEEVIDSNVPNDSVQLLKLNYKIIASCMISILIKLFFI